MGGAGNDSLAGDAANDILVGDAGADTLNGGAGDDSLVGGADSDYYMVDTTNDDVVEGASAGTDSVLANFENYTLDANVEVLILDGTIVQGTGNGDANTLMGNATANTLDGGLGNDSISGGNGADTLLGNTGNDTILGGEGNDSLVGGTGNDSMAGGAGNDYYILDTSLDVVVESSGAGTDSVLVNITGHVLADNVEWLIMGAGLSGTGNAIANTLVGDGDAELLVGNGGNDSIAGGAGIDKIQGANATTFGKSEIDTLTGGNDADQFVLGSASGAFYNDGSASNAGTADYALITDFNPGSDVLVLKGAVANYYTGTHSLTGVSGTGLFLENGAIDELIAIIQTSGAAISNGNTINTASFV